MKYAPRFTCTVLFLAAYLLFSPSSFCAPISKTMRAEDHRLEKRVTIFASRVYVGELLEEWSRQTGVTVSASDRDGASGEQVTVFLKDVPLAQAMNALYSLVSYQQAKWHWSRSSNERKGPGKYRYQLLRPAAARNLAASLRAAVQEDFEAQSGTLLAALNMTPEERREVARRNPEAGALMQSERIMAGLSVFATALSPEARRRVLQGYEQPPVKVSDLPEAVRSFVRSVWEQGQWKRKNRDGEWEPIPEPTWIQFSASREAGQIAPSLYIFMETIGGYGYLGGTPLEKKWQQKISDGWMLSDDAANNAASNVNLKEPEKQPLLQNQNENLYPLVLLRRLKEVSDAAPLSLMARLPLSGKRASVSIPDNLRKSPYRQTVQAFLEALADNPPYLRHKWREGILLLSDPVALLEDVEEARVPWVAVKELRAAQKAAQGGLLSVVEQFDAARRLTQPQLQRLSNDEFPQLRNAALWYDLFRRLERSPEIMQRLQTESGAPLSLIATALRTNPHIEPLLENPKAAYARLITKYDEKHPGVKLLYLRLFTQEGTPIERGFGFAIESVPADGVGAVRRQ